jgi:hypothetical protein
MQTFFTFCELLSLFSNFLPLLHHTSQLAVFRCEFLFQYLKYSNMFQVHATFDQKIIVICVKQQLKFKESSWHITLLLNFIYICLYNLDNIFCVNKQKFIIQIKNELF